MRILDHWTSLTLKSTRPLSGRPNRVVDCIQVAALAAAVKVANRRPLERIYIPFLDVLPTAKHPVRSHQDRILRENRSHCGSVVFVVRLVELLTKVTENLVPRCLVWVIAKLTHVWDIQIELTGSVIGGGSEVDEVSKSARHSFG
jgi:hypothetical protein